MSPERRSEAPWWSVVRRLAADLGVWLAPAAVFLWVYSGSSADAGRALAPHLHLLVIAWSCVALARLAVVACIGRGPLERSARAVSALLASAAVVTLALYYALVLLGLESWGRVISWDLIRSYAAHAPGLADALGLSLYAIAAVMVAAYLAGWALAWVLSGRFDWTQPLARSLSPAVLGAAIGGGAIAAGAEMYNFFAFPPLHAREPVSLTVFPLRGATVLQNVAIDPMRAEKLDSLHDAARAGYQPAADAVRRNVVLIVVDALRADHMSVYGYARQTTPYLDRLAAAGRVRKPAQTRSACSASVCGLLSLLTSKFVHEFSARPVSMHEVLKLHGYRVHMILSGDHSNFYGLKSLYGRADDYHDGSMRPDLYMNDDRVVLERAAGLAPWDGVPVVMQFHLMSAHALGRREPARSRFTPAATYVVPGNRRSPLAENYYDNGVLQADAVIGELLETLRRKGYLENTLVVVTADHGESLGEGGRYTHAHGVHEEALRIPLLLIAYGYRPERRWSDSAIASQVDVAPTILAELGMRRPRTWSGIALQEPGSRRYTYFQEGYAAGLIDHADPQRLWKYWMDSKRRREYAFDLTADPFERSNAIASAPEPLKRAWRLQYLRFQPGGTGTDESLPPASRDDVAVIPCCGVSDATASRAKD